MTLVYFLICLQFPLFGLEKFEILEKKPSEEDSSWYFKKDIEDYFLREPNLNLSSGGNRSRFFQIRGIGEHSQYDTFRSPVLGFFLEGIDLSSSPQALFLGFNPRFKVEKNSDLQWGGLAMGGLIEASSCPPDVCQEQRVSGLIGNAETTNLIFTNPIEISKRWRFKLQGSHFKTNGFQINEYLDQKTGGRNEFNFEFHQFLDLGSWGIETHSLYSSYRNGYDHFSHDSSRTTQSDRPGEENLDLHGHSLKLTKAWGNKSIEFISSVSSSHFSQSFDEDWGNDENWLQLPGWNQNYDYFSKNKNHLLKWHNKINFNSGSWNLGLHAFQFEEEVNNEGFNNGVSRGVTKGELQRQAVALLGGYKIISNSKHEWSLAGRVENQKLKLIEPEKKEDDQLFYSLQTVYKTEVLLGQSQWKVGRSFRAGGFNLDRSALGDRRAFQPETFYFADVAIEEPFEWSNQEWRFFYHMRDDQQLRTSFQDDPEDPSSFSTITQNSGSSEAFGLEWKQAIQLRSLYFRFSVGALYSYFKDYRSPQGNLKGRITPYAPSYTFELMSRFLISSSWDVEGVFYGKDAFYFSNSHNEQSTPYELVDMGLNYKRKNFRLSLYVKNLLDRNYSQRGFYFSNTPPQWNTQLYTQPAPPRVYGLQSSFYF